MKALCWKFFRTWVRLPPPPPFSKLFTANNLRVTMPSNWQSYAVIACRSILFHQMMPHSSVCGHYLCFSACSIARGTTGIHDACSYPSTHARIDKRAMRLESVPSDRWLGMLEHSNDHDYCASDNRYDSKTDVQQIRHRNVVEIFFHMLFYLSLHIFPSHPA